MLMAVDPDLKERVREELVQTWGGGAAVEQVLAKHPALVEDNDSVLDLI